MAEPAADGRTDELGVSALFGEVLQEERDFQRLFVESTAQSGTGKFTKFTLVLSELSE